MIEIEIDQLKNSPLIHGGANYLLSRAQVREFGVAVHDVSKRHGGQQYIHAYNRFIPMKFDKALIYMAILEPTQYDLDNPVCVMLASYHMWDPASANDALEGIFISPSDN